MSTNTMKDQAEALMRALTLYHAAIEVLVQMLDRVAPTAQAESSRGVGTEDGSWAISSQCESAQQDSEEFEEVE